MNDQKFPDKKSWTIPSIPCQYGVLFYFIFSFVLFCLFVVFPLLVISVENERDMWLMQHVQQICKMPWLTHLIKGLRQIISETSTNNDCTKEQRNSKSAKCLEQLGPGLDHNFQFVTYLIQDARYYPLRLVDDDRSIAPWSIITLEAFIIVGWEGDR